MKVGPVVLLFAKYPERGRVKMRLAKHLPEDFVVELYRDFVLDSITCVRLAGLPLVICVDPPGAIDSIRDWLGEELLYLPQRGDDLGDRLRNGFVEVFARGLPSAIALGTDSPDLPPTLLRGAEEGLKANDVVIGPAEDGGYYLIGFKRASFVPSVFAGIKWSTDSVMRDTKARLLKAGCSPHILPMWHDVDVPKDLLRIGESADRDFARSRTAKFLHENRDLWEAASRG